jgi:hypothetical protein
MEQKMRRIGRAGWVSVLAMELCACGPRVSVGILGGDVPTGAAGSSTALAGATQVAAGAMPVGQGGGSSSAGGGDTASSLGGQRNAGGDTAASSGGESNAAGETSRVASGGSAGGDAPVADAGGPADGCPKTLSQFLAPVIADCPAEQPAENATCNSTENGICVWQNGVAGQGSPGYTVMGCYSSVEGNVWAGAAQGQLGEIGQNPQHCPHAQPEAASNCSGHAGEHCYFPYATCVCAADDATWACQGNPKPDLVPAPVQRLCLPAGLDESKPIKDLTDAEVSAWCTWYGNPSGRARPPITDNDPPGMALSYGTNFMEVGVNACLMDLPQLYCEKSLRLRPNCTATLEQLDDCVESIFAVGIGNPGPGWVGHGCGPLLGNQTCSNVIVQQFDPSAGPAGNCKVPLE